MNNINENNESILKLLEKFIEVKNKGWVQSIRRGPTGVGATFEFLIGKSEENFEMPDFYGIEIKTKRYNSSSLVTLFNATPDSHIILGTKRLLSLYGYPDRIIKNVKVLNNVAYASHYTLVGLKYRFKIMVDFNSKKVFLCVYDRYFRFLENKTYWTFELLKEKLERKLKWLAVVIAENKIINEVEYFHYTKMHLYRLKDFDTFIKLLDFGLIRVTFKMGVFRDDERYGKLHNRGTSFDIEFNDIELLYEKIM